MLRHQAAAQTRSGGGLGGCELGVRVADRTDRDRVKRGRVQIVLHSVDHCASVGADRVGQPAGGWKMAGKTS